MPGPTALVGLPAAKTHLGIKGTTDDPELQTFIDRATPIIEDIVGPVVQRDITAEQHTVLSGPRIALLQRPVVSITACTMYVGKVAYEVTVAATPAATGIYGATLDAGKGVLTRWANGVQVDWWGTVYVDYVTGRDTVPANVEAGSLELLRHMWETQRGRSTGRAVPGYDEPMTTTSAGYLVPNRVIEALHGAARADGFA